LSKRHESEAQLPDYAGWEPDNQDSAVNILAESEYDFIDAAYEGTGGFRYGTYLIPHAREGFYVKRQQYSSYTNYVRPAVDAMVNPVFNKAFDRKAFVPGTETEISGNTFNNFIDDCDGAGTTLHEKMWDVSNIGRRHELCFVVMDNFPDNMQPVDARTAVEGRVFPYIFIRTAQQLEEYELDRFGRAVRIVFADVPERVEKKRGAGPEYEERYREYTAEEIRLLKKSEDGKTWEIIDAVRNPIGRMPIVSVKFSRARAGKLLPTPKMYDVCRLSHRIYNLESELRELQRKGVFSFLAINGTAQGSGLTLAKDNALYYPLDHNPPQWIEQSTEDLRAYMEDIEKQENKFRMVLEQNGVTATVTEQSGVAKEWDFRAHEAILRQTSAAAKMAEFEIAQMYQDYTGEVFDYAADYPTEFSPTATQRASMLYDQFLLNQMPEEMRAYTVKKYFRLVHADDNIDVIQPIMDSADMALDDQMQSMAQNGDDG